jgi:hypothetical protein
MPAWAAEDGQRLDAVTVVGKRDVEQMPLSSFSKAAQAFAADHVRAPEATLRFVVMPRDLRVPIASIHLLIEDPRSPQLAPIPIPLAADGTFTIPELHVPLSEDAMVRSNQPVGSLHWRPLVMTAGEPADARRLGDLRLECEAKEAGRLNRPDLPFFARVFGSSASECASGDEHFFIAPSALAGVTLDDGTRQVDIAPDRVAESSNGRLIPRSYHLYEDGWRDRAYSPPLGDLSWSDNTLVRFHYLAGPPTASSQALGGAAVAPGS